MSKLRPLEPNDLPDLLELSRQAGWNQTADDWQRLLALQPDGCYGMEVEGRIVSSTTAICYVRELAWIGMVLTHVDHRGKGFARALMAHMLDWLRRRRIVWIKLDATDQGRPIYAALGFQDQCPVERWKRPAGPPPPPGRLREYPFVYDPSFDRAAFGANRADLLRALAGHESVSMPGRGYAMGRAGANAAYFGPCVTHSASAARLFLDWFLSRHASHDVFWDLFPDNAAAVHLAREYGFEPVRHLMRMAIPGVDGARPLIHNDACVYAIAGFEYG